MSGILAIFQQHTPVKRTQLEQMAEKIKHRGPDAFRAWFKGPVGLAECTLKTTEEDSLSSELTPIGDGLVLSWDGQIHNREEILSLLPIRFRPNRLSDAELLLRAYRQWGPDCLARIVGDFAFLLWDETRQRLFAARDRMGIRPFHYAWDGSNFYAASEAKALFRALGRTPEPEERMFAALLAYCNFSEEENHLSFFKGIKRLPPAHFLILEQGRLEIRRYWSPDLKKTLHYSNFEDYAEHFSNLLAQAVESRLRSSQPVFSLLSGGLDSSAITCLASERQLEKRPCPKIQALNLYGADPLSDERRYARLVAQAKGIPLHEIFSHSTTPFPGLDELLWKAEAPILSTSRDTEHYLFVRERGSRVVLSGEGGDQLLDEFGAPADLLARGQVWAFGRMIRSFAGSFGAPLNVFLKATASHLLPEPIIHLRRKLIRNVPPPWLKPAFVASTQFDQRLYRKSPELAFHSFSQKSTYQDVTHPYSILKWEVEERMFGLHGLEVRYPFLDSRLFEFMLALPWQIRAMGERKAILRQGLRSNVPQAILTRKDKGEWTSEMDASMTPLCKKSVPEPLLNESGRLQDILDFKQVQKMVQKFLFKDRDAVRTTLWFIMTSDHFLKQFKTGVPHETQEIQSNTKTLHHANAS